MEEGMEKRKKEKKTSTQAGISSLLPPAANCAQVLCYSCCVSAGGKRDVVRLPSRLFDVCAILFLLCSFSSFSSSFSDEREPTGMSASDNRRMQGKNEEKKDKRSPPLSLSLSLFLSPFPPISLSLSLPTRHTTPQTRGSPTRTSPHTTPTPARWPTRGPPNSRLS